MTQLVRFEKVGDTRPNTVTLHKGKRIELEDRGTMVVQSTVLIDVLEIYEYYNPVTKMDKEWRIQTYYIDTIRPVPPGRWRRFWAWLQRRPLPKAIVIKEAAATTPTTG